MYSKGLIFFLNFNQTANKLNVYISRTVQAANLLINDWQSLSVCHRTLHARVSFACVNLIDRDGKYRRNSCITLTRSFVYSFII